MSTIPPDRPIAATADPKLKQWDLVHLSVPAARRAIEDELRKARAHEKLNQQFIIITGSLMTLNLQQKKIIDSQAGEIEHRDKSMKHHKALGESLLRLVSDFEQGQELSREPDSALDAILAEVKRTSTSLSKPSEQEDIKELHATVTAEKTRAKIVQSGIQQVFGTLPAAYSQHVGVDVQDLQDLATEDLRQHFKRLEEEPERFYQQQKDLLVNAGMLPKMSVEPSSREMDATEQADPMEYTYHAGYD